MPTVSAAFANATRRWADRPFLHVLDETAHNYGIPAGRITYAQAAARVDALTDRYRRAGYGVGHRIGLVLENRPAMFFHWFALNALGVSVVPFSPELRPAERDWLISHSGACFVVTADEARLPDAPGPARAEKPDATAECALLYTSGTTGKPKGCVLTNDYFLRCGRWYAEIGGLCTLHPGEDRLITPLPMNHMNAMGCSTLGMVMTGGCIIPLDRFHPRTWWQSVRESDATIMHCLGVMPSMLLGLDPTPDERAHRVRFGFAPGIDPRLHAAFEQRFNIPMIDAWAMTETGCAAAIIAAHEPRIVGQSCFGRPGPHIALRIVDQNGADTPDGTPGELLVRAAGSDPRAGFFSRYLNDPEATEAAWQGGWFHTGDVVRRDAAGNLYFVDRWKNVIRRSGENIAAAEVESVLRRHPLVRDVACAPVPDELRGEEVLACIIPTAPVTDPPTAAADIVRHVLSELAYYKAPGYVAFVDALPLTATNKVQRGELRTFARALPGTPDCIDTRHLKRRT